MSEGWCVGHAQWANTVRGDVVASACGGRGGSESGEAEDEETGRVVPIYFLNHKKERGGYAVFLEISCSRTCSGEKSLLSSVYRRSKHHILSEMAFLNWRHKEDTVNSGQLRRDDVCKIQL